MELYCTSKVNTLQLNTASSSSNTRTRPTCTASEHSLPFLQSESFQIHVGTIHCRAIGPLAHHNGTSAYTSLTCHLPAPTIKYLLRPPYKLTCFRPTSTRSLNQLFKSIEVRRQQSCYYGTQLQLVYIVAWQLKVRPSIIVTYLRKPHICNNIVNL
jgi:hypothetical protein